MGRLLVIVPGSRPSLLDRCIPFRRILAMTRPPIPEELWAAIPPAARAAVSAVLAALQQQVEELRAELADLRGRVSRDSSNSSRPPSSDPPHAKTALPKIPSGRRKGGQ